MSDKHLLVNLIVDVVGNPMPDPADRAALADLLEEAGRDEEAALVRSCVPTRPHFPDPDDFGSVQVVAGVWRSELTDADLSDGEPGERVDLFADN